VPTDLKPSGKRETFAITVAYDTLELYGKLQASRTFTIACE
jgi:hypothetical protein